LSGVQTGIGSVYTYLTVNLEWTVNAEIINYNVLSERVLDAECTVICIKL